MVYVHVQPTIQAHVCIKTGKFTPTVVTTSTVHLHSEMESFFLPCYFSLHKPGQLTQELSGILLSLPLTSSHSCSALHGFWGSELSSCLRGKRFTHWAIFPAYPHGFVLIFYYLYTCFFSRQVTSLLFLGHAKFILILATFVLIPPLLWNINLSNAWLSYSFFRILLTNYLKGAFLNYLCKIDNFHAHRHPCSHLFLPLLSDTLHIFNFFFK